MHFAAHAPAAGIPVPETSVFSKAAIDGGEADGFCGAPRGPDGEVAGAGGGRECVSGDIGQDCKDQIAEFPAQSPVLLQEILDTGRWREMTVDCSSPESVEISNVRQILFAGEMGRQFYRPELP